MSRVGADVSSVSQINDTTILDTTSDATYDYFGRAPRGSAEGDDKWYIERTHKTTLKTESASSHYDMSWTDRASHTYA